MYKKIAAGVFFIPLVIVAFLDLNNKLSIGPKNTNGATPFEHGIFGTTVKVLLCLAASICVYTLFLTFIKRRWLTLTITLLIAVILLVGGYFVSISIYGLF